MYSKLAFFVVSALALGAVAGGDPAPAGSVTTSQCDTGALKCCKSVQSAGSKAAQTAAGLVGAVLGDVTAQVGLHCTSVLGGNDCTTQSACCTGNDFHGVIVIGCSPINVNA